MSLKMNNPFFAASTFLTAYSQSDYFGKFVFLCLFFLSVISWVVLLQKIQLTRKLKGVSYKILDIFEKNKQKLLDITISNMNFKNHPYCNLYEIMRKQTLEVLNKNRYFSKEKQGVYLSQADIEMIGSRMHMVIVQKTKSYEKNLFILSTIVTLAPFLGLLGTVWGILVTFAQLQNHSLSTGNSTVLAGLSMALATTVIGLIVAIPALIAYNYLKAASRDFRNDMEDFAHHLLTNVEIQYRNVEGN
jgi:biopolymer transport protein TolQ